MEQLSPLSAAFLEIEDADRNAALSIASVAVIDGPAVDQQDFIDAITARLSLIPRYRQRIRRIPFALGPPVWVDDAHFDAASHFRRVALPAPGDEAALCDLIALIVAERLDRDRPLWECWVIEGLTGGRWAVLSKVHHCLADGVSANALHDILFTNSSQPPDAVERAGRPEPSTFALISGALRGIATGPVCRLRLLGASLRSPERLAQRVTDTAHGLGVMAAALIPAAPSSLTGAIGRQRRYSLAHAALPEIKEIGHHFHVTVNDVVLSAITAALRDLLLRRGERPTADTLRTLVPVSTRNERRIDTLDNRISLMLPLLPVDVSDPALRLIAVHRRLSRLKASKEVDTAATLTRSAGYGPFAPLAWGVRAVARLPQRNIVTVATNVPGPRRPLTVLGRHIVELYPYAPIALRMRIGVAVLTYQDRLSFGITSDLRSVPETGFLARAIESDLSALLGIARS
jgi:diacylglycerol O-acyltransferase